MKVRLERMRTGDKGVVAFRVPESVQEKFWKAVARNPDQGIVEVGTQPRTTGPRSQNGRVYFLLNLLSQFTGETVSRLKELAKLESIAAGYPYRWVQVRLPDGRHTDQIEPFHEDELNTVEISILINWLEMKCAECGIATERGRYE